MRFYLIDRVEKICFGKYAAAIKCITLADEVFDYHFPGQPVFPGTLIIEGLAQLSGMLLELTVEKKEMPLKLCVPAIVNKMKFRKTAKPGDRLHMRADIVSLREDFGVVKVKAEIDGETCTEGELTFSLFVPRDEALRQSRKDVYKIYMRDAIEIP
jgi:3-hydroxyacyl-[acyl-carrier-protein] dehydratase